MVQGVDRKITLLQCPSTLGQAWISAMMIGSR